jgi:hypothetical protein
MDRYNEEENADHMNWFGVTRLRKCRRPEVSSAATVTSDQCPGKLKDGCWIREIWSISDRSGTARFVGVDSGATRRGSATHASPRCRNQSITPLASHALASSMFTACPDFDTTAGQQIGSATWFWFVQFYTEQLGFENCNMVLCKIVLLPAACT